MDIGVGGLHGQCAVRTVLKATDLAPEHVMTLHRCMVENIALVLQTNSKIALLRLRVNQVF